MRRRRRAGVPAGVGGRLTGFTVSLFIARLAFDDGATVDAAKVGSFAGSAISARLGMLNLGTGARRARAPAPAV